MSYETIRRWCRTFGRTYADRVRRRRPRPGDKWYLDEVQIKVNGRKHWLWGAVDQAGVVLDILVQERRNQEAAEAFLRRLLEVQQDEPCVARLVPGGERRSRRPYRSKTETRVWPV